MTYQDDFTLPAEIMEQLAAGGMAYLPELIQTLVNAAMQMERQKYLGAARYEHNPERVGHANGYRPKTVKTRMGEVTFDVPQVREGGFYPHALEKGLRSERALTLTLAEMYVQGVSTRKVAAVKSLPARSVARPRCWTKSWKRGATVNWEKLSICCWMPAMRKCARMDAFGMWPCWWRPGSTGKAIARCWGSRFP